MKLLSGPTSLELTKSIALLTKLPMLLLNFKHFYDGETYLAYKWRGGFS